MSERHDDIARFLRKLHDLWMRDSRRTFGRVVAIATPYQPGAGLPNQPAYGVADAEWEAEIDLMLSDDGNAAVGDQSGGSQ